jgi:hypothetical protein
MVDFIRTEGGCYAQGQTILGSFLYPIKDPEAKCPEPKPEERFELNPDLPPIPKELWGRMVNLFIHMAKNFANSQEVQVRLLYRLEGPDESGTPWKIVVPRQTVGPGHVDSPNLNDSCDIVTGQPVGNYPPEGYVDAGSSHSHHTMTLSFSSSVDDPSDLASQGIHFLINSVKFSPEGKTTYYPEARISYRQNFYYLTFEQVGQVVDLTPTTETFHPTALTYIQMGSYRSNNFFKTGANKSSTKMKSSHSVGAIQSNSYSESWWDDDYYMSTSGRMGKGLTDPADELGMVIEDLVSLNYSQHEIESIIVKHYAGWHRGLALDVSILEDSQEELEILPEDRELLYGPEYSEEDYQLWNDFELEEDFGDQLIEYLIGLNYPKDVVLKAIKSFLDTLDPVPFPTCENEVQEVFNIIAEEYNGLIALNNKNQFRSLVQIASQAF